MVDVKSRAGRRSVGIPAPLLAEIQRHRIQQQEEQRTAARLWEDGGWMFAQPNGRPIDPRQDHGEWKALLDQAGVRDARLHDARHTAATMLLVLNVATRAVMDVMGWWHVSLPQRYQHIAKEVRESIAAQVGGLLWNDN